MESNTAAQQVLAITELIEAILIHVNVKDLLFAQAVRVKWKRVIDRSHPLQKSLFFQPATSEIAFYHERALVDATSGKTDELESADFHYICSPEAVRLVQAFERRRPYHSRFLYTGSQGKSAAAGKRLRDQTLQVKTELAQAITKTNIFLNPLLLEKFYFLAKLFKKQASIAQPPAPPRGAGIPDIIQIDREKAFRNPKFARPEASWRRMLSSQPPLGALSRESERHIHRFNSVGCLDISKPIRMEALESLLRNRRLDFMPIKGHKYCRVWKSGRDLRKIGKGN